MKFFALIESDIDVGESTNGKNILPIERVLMFFWWTRACSNPIHDSITHDISDGSVYKSIDMVIEAIFKQVPSLIQLPSEEEAFKEARLFQSRTGFPPIAWAAIDGTHITVRFPTISLFSLNTLIFGTYKWIIASLQVTPNIEYRAECRNRKNGLSINSMVCAGASFKIYAATADSPGSQHDARVYRESELYQRLTVDKFKPIPHGIILADKAYPVSLSTNFILGVSLCFTS